MVEAFNNLTLEAFEAIAISQELPAQIDTMAISRK
jgi:hypothetical protein